MLGLSARNGYALLRSGCVRVHLADLHTALDLLGVVIDADLREHGRLPQRDHDEVLMRALRRLSTALEQRALSEVSESLAQEIASGDPWHELATSGDDPEELDATRGQLEELAAGLLSASYGALAFADFLDEPQARPLTALRFFSGHVEADREHAETGRALIARLLTSDAEQREFLAHARCMAELYWRGWDSMLA